MGCEDKWTQIFYFREFAKLMDAKINGFTVWHIVGLWKTWAYIFLYMATDFKHLKVVKLSV